MSFAVLVAAASGPRAEAPAKTTGSHTDLLPLETAKAPSSKTRVRIKNDGGIRLAFFLSTNNRNWKRFRLPAGKARYYSSSRKDLKFLYIKVKTRKRGFVNYRLRVGEQFMIRWNKKKKVWDVLRIEYVRVKEEK